MFGWACLLAIVAVPLSLWCFRGEAFFALTNPLRAEVLVVESWIGIEGARAAGAEFKDPSHGYKNVVLTGGLTGQRWDQKRWSQVEIARVEFDRAGVSADRIIPAPAEEAEAQRTYMMALSAKRALEARGLHPKTVNVFTRGVHARRSRLIFSKVFGPETKVGVLAWIPPGWDPGPWWKSTNRAEDLFMETIGYFYEAAFDSGRRSKPADDVQLAGRPSALTTVPAQNL